MSYTSTIQDHYTVDFAATAQNKRDRVNKVISQYARMETDCTGERKTFNIDDFVEGRETTGQRFSKLNVQEPLGEIRSVTPREFDLTLGKERKDGRKLYPLITGNGSHVMNHTRFYNRTCDKVFREGIYGDNHTGADGTTVTNIPAGNQLAVNFVQTGSPAASNLTVGKLLEVSHLARQSELIGKDTAFEDSQIHCSINSAMLKSLEFSVFNDSNKDFASFEALRDNKTDTFKNIVFHRTEDVPYTGTTNIYDALFWIPELVVVGVWEAFEYRAWEESTLSFAPLTWSMFSMASCRLQDNGVFTAACNVTL